VFTIEKKRVVVFSLAWLPFVGGAEVAWHEITKRLKHKYDFTVVTSRSLDWCSKLLYLPMSVLNGLFFKADCVVGVLENQAGLAALFVSWIKRKPCIINLQSGDSEEYIYKKLGVFGLLYDLVYSGGKRVVYVVLSKYLKKRAMNHGVSESQIVIVPNGVDTKIFSPQKKVLPYHNILTVSRLVYKNGVDTLIKAFNIVKQKYPECTLTICGTGEHQFELSKLALRLNLSESVVFVGNVDYESLPVYYNNASVFVRPSRSEGFGNSFIEAMSCGVPIIGTKVGGIPDFLEDEVTGLFCKVDDSKDLAQKIVLLLEDKNLKSKLVKNGLQYVKKYDWNNIASKFDKQFEKVIT